MNHTVAKERRTEGAKKKLSTREKDRSLLQRAVKSHVLHHYMHTLKNNNREMMYMCVKAQLLELFGRRKNIDFFPL